MKSTAESSQIIQKATILMIDDQSLNLQTYRFFLEDHYQLLESLSAEDGFTLAISNKPDLILLDISMPQMDGLELIQLLKKNKQTCSIPVIFVTGHNDTETVLKVFRLGADDYINKPVQGEELQKRVENTLQKYATAKIVHQQNKLIQEQSTLAAKGDMLSMIAHQWRQPLSIVTTNISNMMFSIELGELDEAEQLELLQKSMQTLQDLSKTLEQFQSFKNLKIETQILQSEDFYNELLEYITAQYKAKNISFTLDPKSTKTFATSKYLSKLILSKLIENSLEAIEEKRIANGTITILLQSDADKSLMQISDNGGGVSENNITKIFDPYFSTKSLNARGLGLHMVKNYVQNALDGTIECNNKHDGFSCTITVPNKR